MKFCTRIINKKRGTKGAIGIAPKFVSIVCTTNLFQRLYTSKRGSSLLGKNLSSYFRRIIPFQKTQKLKLLLRNVSPKDNDHILKFFTEGSENLVLIPRICHQKISSGCGCIQSNATNNHFLTVPNILPTHM